MILYDIYEMKDGRWVVTDVTQLLDDMYTEFGKDNVRLINCGVYSIHDPAGTIVAILVKSAPAE